MVAALEGKTEVFPFLRENGANINNRNKVDDVSLHWADLLEGVDIFKFWLDKGISLALTNIEKKITLHISAHYWKLEPTKAVWKEVLL